MVKPHLGIAVQVKKMHEDRVKKSPVSLLPRFDKSWNTLCLSPNGLNSGKALECEKQWKVLLSQNNWLIFLPLLLPGPKLFRKSWHWLRKCAGKHTYVSYVAWFAHELLFFRGSIICLKVFAVCTEANWPCTVVIEHHESCWVCLLWIVYMYFVSIWGCILNHILDVIFKSSLVSTNLYPCSVQGRKRKHTPAIYPLTLSVSGVTLPVKTIPSKCLFPLQ